MRCPLRTSAWILLFATMQFQLAPGQQPSINDDGTRHRYPLNEQWEFLEKNIDDFELAMRSEKWEKIDLPHTWNAWDAVDPVPGYRRAAGWYRKQLQIPKFKNDSRFILSFEGVNIVCEVFVNGKKAGGHAGGYVGFDLDITPSIRFGENNTIVVWVHNRIDPQIIPSQKSDFCIYGGIPRDVWLDVVPSAYIDRVRIRTPRVSAQTAELEVAAIIHAASADRKSVELEAVLVDPSGKEVARRSVRRNLDGQETSILLGFSGIARPELWSPGNPALYTARVAMKLNGKMIDEVSDRFGFRWFEFKEHGPFFLNGRRLLLRGTHRHEDYAGYANAMPDSLHRKDMRMIKEMGANFVRLAHYPQDPEVYRACDELGLLVWDELPWCRGGMGDEAWKNNTKRLLREQIERYYNHPSIIIRSLGNEMYWLPDFPGGDNLDSLRALVKELNDIAHALDPDRLTATRKFTEGADLVDIVSPSIWPGWYSGYYKGYELALKDAREKLPKFLHAEYGGDSHVGRHVENPVSGDATTTSDGWEENIKPRKVKNVSQMSDWSESYIVDLFDWMLGVSESLDWFTGAAQWAFKDFPTPLRPENPMPYVNQKGLVDRAGRPKDAYYVFKSYWTSSPEFCYIESHTWTERTGPPNVSREVNVFSNCEEVELSLAGSSLGTKKRVPGKFPAGGLTWMVPFSEGSNTMIATGYKDGRRVTEDRIQLNYSFTRNDVADRVEISSERLGNGNFMVVARAVDKNGRRCLDYNKRIYFASEGSGQVLENYGTPTGSSIIEMANGEARIEVEPGSGPTVVEARNQDFKGAYITIEARGN